MDEISQDYREGYIAGVEDAEVSYNAVIKFALDQNTESGDVFLRLWYEGEFDVCRNEWPEAPEECYGMADPLHGMYMYGKEL